MTDGWDDRGIARLRARMDEHVGSGSAGGLAWGVPTGSSLRGAASTSFNTFSGDRSIYWSATGGTKVVQGQIRQAWLPRIKALYTNVFTEDEATQKDASPVTHVAGVRISRRS